MSLKQTAEQLGRLIDKIDAARPQKLDIIVTRGDVGKLKAALPQVEHLRVIIKKQEGLPPGVTFEQWRLQVQAERLALSQRETPAGPSEAQADPALEAAKTDLPTVLAKARVGKAEKVDPLALADALAAKVEISAAVQTLAAELGLRVTASRRGIEARRNDVMEFVESSMDRMHATLMQLRLRELESLLK